mmetsp:Transcript_112326/g.198245  ORF Transcript_112326/g.198245 Transcript_112326/m.198245 type:complete len:868 (-) Transcript_112326:66-2669(-)
MLGGESVLIASVASAHGLTDPEYRVGDLTKSAAAECLGGIILKPRVKLTLGDFSVATHPIETQTGDATFMESLLLPCHSDSATISVEVYHSAWVQSFMRGDPLIGAGRLLFARDAPNSEHEVYLTRGSSSTRSRGSIRISITAAIRQRRELVLAKNSLLPGFFLKKHVATHWGIAIVDSSFHEKIYEILIASAQERNAPVGVLGPQGLIAHSVEQSAWNDWKQRVTADRARKDLLRPSDKERLKKGEHISEEEWRGMLRSRCLKNFDSAQVHVGCSFRNDGEITTFIHDWVQEHPEYEWDMNCQNFAEELFTFLTCGDTLDRLTIDEGIKTVINPVNAVLKSKDLLSKAIGMPSVAKVSQPLLKAALMPGQWRYDDLMNPLAESNPLRWSENKPTIVELERDLKENAKPGRPIFLKIRTDTDAEPICVSCSDKCQALNWLREKKGSKAAGSKAESRVRSGSKAADSGAERRVQRGSKAADSSAEGRVQGGSKATDSTFFEGFDAEPDAGGAASAGAEGDDTLDFNLYSEAGSYVLSARRDERIVSKHEGRYMFDRRSGRIQDGTGNGCGCFSIQEMPPSFMIPAEGGMKPLNCITVTNSEIMVEIQKPTNIGAFFVLPSQLNGAEYQSFETDYIVRAIDDYQWDNTGGPRGQLAVHPAAGQFVLDNAANDTHPDGISAVANVIKEVKDKGYDFELQNGYLKVPVGGASKAIEAWKTALKKFKMLVMEDVPASGLQPDKAGFSAASHRVNLVYASAVPVQTYNNGYGDMGMQIQVAGATLVAQYYGALSIAARRGSPSSPRVVYLMPLGGGVFENPPDIIVKGMSLAVEMLTPEERECLDVHILTFHRNNAEVREFRRLLGVFQKLNE